MTVTVTDAIMGAAGVLVIAMFAWFVFALAEPRPAAPDPDLAACRAICSRLVPDGGEVDYGIMIRRPDGWRECVCGAREEAR